MTTAVTRAALLARLVAVATLGAPGGALARPEHCLGTAQRQWVIDETLIGVVNPEGFEHQLRVALCLPLITRPGLLFDYTHFEVGLTDYLGPVYNHLGVYTSVDPLSFLQLRADAQGVVYWPLHFVDGAGYFALPGYTSRYADDRLPDRAARSAVGFNATLSATLRGAVDLTARVGLLVTSYFAGDFWYVGDSPYYVNLRRDVVLARSDWLLKSTTHLLVDVRLREGLGLHVGVTDDLTYVPRSGYLGNLIGGWVSLPIRRRARLREVEPFVRVGGYTHHAFRTTIDGGLQLFGGLSVAWAWPGAR